MIQLKDSYINSFKNSQLPTLHLNIESKVKELPLYDFQIDNSAPGKEVAQAFQSNLLLPGVILTEQGKFSGIISQRQFLEIMSSPYGLELFSRRSIFSLYRFVNQDVLRVPGELQISEAARRALQRQNHLVYEPILVEIEPSVYRLLNMHQLLIADSQIHQLTCNLLHEKMDKQTLELSQQIEKVATLTSVKKVIDSKDIRAIITSEIKNPLYWNQTFTLLFVYCQSLKEVLSNYEALAAQEASGTSKISAESNQNLILNKLSETLKTMQTDSTRLTKFIAGLQILLKRI
jgi:hypothetical protein